MKVFGFLSAVGNPNEPVIDIILPNGTYLSGGYESLAIWSADPTQYNTVAEAITALYNEYQSALASGSEEEVFEPALIDLPTIPADIDTTDPETSRQILATFFGTVLALPEDEGITIATSPKPITHYLTSPTTLAPELQEWATN